MTHEEKIKRRKAILYDIASGMSLAECSDKHGLAENTIYRLCKDRGIEPLILPMQKQLGVNTYKIIAQLQNTMKSLEEIAQDCRVTKQRVHEIQGFMLANGIQIRLPQQRGYKRKTFLGEK